MARCRGQTSKSRLTCWRSDTQGTGGWVRHGGIVHRGRRARTRTSIARDATRDAEAPVDQAAPFPPDSRREETARYEEFAVKDSLAPCNLIL
jgi:hypothetical protein